MALLKAAISSLLAAAFCTYSAIGALPKFPENLPWPPIIGYVALGIVFLSIWAVFLLLSLLLKDISTMRFRAMLVVLPLICVTACFFVIPLVPLALSLPVVYACTHLFENCGIRLQGLSNVLQSFPLAFDFPMGFMAFLIFSIFNDARFYDLAKGK